MTGKERFERVAAAAARHLGETSLEILTTRISLQLRGELLLQSAHPGLTNDELEGVKEKLIKEVLASFEEPSGKKQRIEVILV